MSLSNPRSTTEHAIEYLSRKIDDKFEQIVARTQEKSLTVDTIVPIFTPGIKDFTPDQLEAISGLKDTPGFPLILEALKNIVMKYQVELGGLGLTNEQTANLVAGWRVAQQFYLEFSQWPNFAEGTLHQIRQNAVETPAHNRIFTGVN